MSSRIPSGLLWASMVVLSVSILGGSAARGELQLSIGFLDPSPPNTAAKHNAAGLAFARTQGAVTVLRGVGASGWLDSEGNVCAPEQFDVIWYHQGDDPSITLGMDANDEILDYLKGGGAMLLSGAAGRLLNDTAIEPTPLRVLGTSTDAFVSGIVVRDAFREHDAFKGLDVGKPIVLTSFGGNALADFYGTAGPHGDILAEGNAGVGERPLVEYKVGAGRVIFVGWRLADFTTNGDDFHANLDRLFENLLRYLQLGNSNRAQLIKPAAPFKYVRVLGIPFLKADAPFDFETSASSGRYAAILSDHPAAPTDYALGDLHVSEMPIATDPIRVKALGLTCYWKEKPVTQAVRAMRAEQDAMDKHDQDLMAGLEVVKPDVTFIDAPLKPLAEHRADRSVLLGRSVFMAPGEGLGDAQPVYEPVEDGGFRIANSARQLNRPIVHGQNRVWTGDAPIFRMDTVTGNGSYADKERVFPLWPRPDAQVGNVNPCMGTLRLGVHSPSGGTQWFELLKNVATTFRPGYTEYRLADSAAGWTATVTIAPALDFHGLICRVAFDKPVPLIWRYGGVFWSPGEANANHVEFRGAQAWITEPKLPNNLVVAGWDAVGDGHLIEEPYGQELEFTANVPQEQYHVMAAWGVTAYDEARARTTMARLDTPNAAAWPESRDRLKQLWFDCYIGRALDPAKHFHELAAAPDEQLRRTCAWWDDRRAAFQIRTPDPHLNALINWSRCTTEHHRQGPALVLGGQIWQMYSHISTGWSGKEWGGDHQAMEELLRFYGAMQGEDGFIRWVSPSLVAFDAENNTSYWVDQVWRHYTWTADSQFVRDLWPAVRKAVAWQRAKRDPDGDGLFQDFYEYWNCDSNGKGPKSAAPSATSWRMLECAANLARVVGDEPAEQEYRGLAAKTKEMVLRELWREDKGRLGSIGADGLWRGHPQTWEEYLAINAGLLNADQGRRAMRWLAAHYGFEPIPGVHLLACSDWYPTRWSVQWVPTGDTCLAALAGMKCGDVGLWWPYLKTAVLSAFRSDFPGINMGIANSGAGGGDREDVDSVDPYTHATVRGVFGIEPALHENRIDICPAFPSEWSEASIRTPDITYEYRREGDAATFRIHTPRPLVKRVRANLTGPETETPTESDSVVRAQLGPVVTPPDPVNEPPILMTQTDPGKNAAKPLEPDERSRQVLVDLSGACNRTTEAMIADGYIYDYAHGAAPIDGWWGNPKILLPQSPRMIDTPAGVRFLTAGRPPKNAAKAPNNLIALSSWRPYPLPGGARIAIGRRCERLWLLLQSYVHPMKNYVTNGEVVLHYISGESGIEPLIPPYNLDCYFQHFSLKGIAVPLGQLSLPSGWSFVHAGLSSAHADALEIAADPARAIESIEFRATCSERVLGLAAITLLPAN